MASEAGRSARRRLLDTSWRFGKLRPDPFQDLIEALARLENIAFDEDAQRMNIHCLSDGRELVHGHRPDTPFQGADVGSAADRTKVLLGKAPS